MRTWRDGMPENVASEIARGGVKLQLLEAPIAPLDSAQIFTTEGVDLAAKLSKVMPLLTASGLKLAIRKEHR